MKRFVLDANALVCLYRNAPGAETVQRLLEQGKAGKARLVISVVNLAEVYYVLAKYFAPKQALVLVEAARAAIETMPVDDRVALDTAALKIRHKMGLADCFAAELAMRLTATLVTADPEFRKLGKQLKLLQLPGLHEQKI